MRSSHINGNLYHYGGNNPVKYTDPTGRWFIIDDIIFAIFSNWDKSFFKSVLLSLVDSWKHPIEHGKDFFNFYNESNLDGKIKLSFAGDKTSFDSETLPKENGAMGEKKKKRYFSIVFSNIPPKKKNRKTTDIDLDLSKITPKENQNEKK